MKHKAKFYGIPCFFEEPNILYGRNLFYDKLVNFMTYLHVFISIIFEFFTGNGFDFPIFIFEDDNENK